MSLYYFILNLMFIREPFCMEDKDERLLLARYLVEDNNE